MFQTTMKLLKMRHRQRHGGVGVGKPENEVGGNTENSCAVCNKSDITKDQLNYCNYSKKVQSLIGCFPIYPRRNFDF